MHDSAAQRLGMINVRAQGCTSSHAHTVPRHHAHLTRMRSDSQASNNPTHAAYATLVAFSPQHGPGQLPALTPRVTTAPSCRRSPEPAIIPVKLDLRASTCEHRLSPRARSVPSVTLFSTVRTHMRWSMSREVRPPTPLHPPHSNLLHCP